MACGCGSGKNHGSNKEFQDLSDWENYTLEGLKEQLSEGVYKDEEVRVYNVASTWFDGSSDDKSSGMIRHKGTGPNLEGGLATLCTCKRSMRQGRPPEYWKGKWILGVTSRAKSQGFDSKHYFLYLMKVKCAFESHKELYDYLEINRPSALDVKIATKNAFGDIYVPRFTCNDPLDPSQYESPCDDHDHSKVPDKKYTAGEEIEWEMDISKKYSTERLSTPQLLGDIDNTFVWQKKMIRFKEDRGPGNKIILMKELLSNLSEES